MTDRGWQGGPCEVQQLREDSRWEEPTAWKWKVANESLGFGSSFPGPEFFTTRPLLKRKGVKGYKALVPYICPQVDMLLRIDSTSLFFSG